LHTPVRTLHRNAFSRDIAAKVFEERTEDIRTIRRLKSKGMLLCVLPPSLMLLALGKRKVERSLIKLGLKFLDRDLFNYDSARKISILLLQPLIFFAA
jgi:hypothetical protein